MKATELRIGNYIDYTTEREIVTMQTTYEYIRLIHNGNKNFKPIPLTEEWLLKFGFVKEFNADENSDSFYLKDCDDSFYIDYDNSWYIGATSYGYLKGIHYVHQLQNLYFALTNEELTLIK